MTDQRETDVPKGKSTVRHFIEMLFLLGVVITLLCLVFGDTSKGEGYEPFNLGTGTILVDSAVCFSTNLNADVITLLKTYQEAVDVVDDFDRGVGPLPSEDMIIFGTAVEENALCAVTSGSYPVFIRRLGDRYVLLKLTDLEEEGPDFVAAEIDVLFDKEI